MDERHVLILRASPFRTIFRFALKGTSLRAPAKQSRGHENNSGLLRRFAPRNDDLTAVLRCPLASRRGVIVPDDGPNHLRRSRRCMLAMRKLPVVPIRRNPTALPLTPNQI